MMIRLGTPNLCVIFGMNSAALAAVVAETGFTSIHLMNLSMAMLIFCNVTNKIRKAWIPL